VKEARKLKTYSGAKCSVVGRWILVYAICLQVEIRTRDHMNKNRGVKVWGGGFSYEQTGR
jgi:hypothetical protein